MTLQPDEYRIQRWLRRYRARYTCDKRIDRTSGNRPLVYIPRSPRKHCILVVGQVCRSTPGEINRNYVVPTNSMPCQRWCSLRSLLHPGKSVLKRELSTVGLTRASFLLSQCECNVSMNGSSKHRPDDDSTFSVCTILRPVVPVIAHDGSIDRTMQIACALSHADDDSLEVMQLH